MHEVTRKIMKIVTVTAHNVVDKGGDFTSVRYNMVKKLTKKYPGLNEGTLLGGFNHEYATYVAKKVS